MKVKSEWLSHRGCGVLLHPSSLPGSYGIGNLGSISREWIDFLADAGFSHWQTCPVGPTGYGDSPYQVFSSSAGNPYFIDLSALVENSYLEHEDVVTLRSLSGERIDYGELYQLFFTPLRKAFDAFKKNPSSLEDSYGKFSDFKKRHAHWLEGFAVFQTLKRRNQSKPWWEWPAEDQDPLKYRSLDSDEMHELDFQSFLQYLFYSQWRDLRIYASQKEISLIGDLPIYVAPDSADVWTNRDLFQIKANGTFEAVAGVPPDYFNEMGQLWGNPLYDWQRHKETDYQWWIQRACDQLELFDIIRIDHFRAFHDYWSIPSSLMDASKGEWETGPGMDFWNRMQERFPKLPFLAEDLGDINDKVRALREQAGLPGMAVLQFAFDGNPGNLYLPHNLSKEIVLYTGTHDNDTSLGWYHSVDEGSRSFFRRYLNVDGSSPGWDMLRHAYRSVSQLVVVLAQDLLSLGSDARFNVPGVASGNWGWRMTNAQFQQLKQESTSYLREQALLADRLHSGLQSTQVT